MIASLPERIETVEQLEEMLSRPSDRLVEFMAGLSGDLMVLGATGKIGPSLVRMAARAVAASGVRRHVLAVSRHPLEGVGEEVCWLPCDLLDPEAVRALPQVENVIFMAGRKFGSTGAEPLTWMTNVVAPYHVAATFTASRVVVFSTGCVYPLLDVASGGATEKTPPAPVGEYAQSCLGRERVFDHFSETLGERVLHFRLNYAIDLRYGVLYDIARQVWDGKPVDVTTGYANVIWQGDACNMALLGLGLAASPAAILNVTGPEIVSVRETALAFGRLLGKEVAFSGRENGLAYLSDPRRAMALFGPPSVSLSRMIEWTAHWLQIGGPTMDKPTHFELQDGKY